MNDNFLKSYDKLMSLEHSSPEKCLHINKKFDEDMLAFKNKYYNLFYVILVTAVAFSFTIYKTFIK